MVRALLIRDHDLLTVFRCFLTSDGRPSLREGEVDLRGLELIDIVQKRLCFQLRVEQLKRVELECHCDELLGNGLSKGLPKADTMPAKERSEREWVSILTVWCQKVL